MRMKGGCHGKGHEAEKMEVWQKKREKDRMDKGKSKERNTKKGRRIMRRKREEGGKGNIQIDE